MNKSSLQPRSFSLSAFFTFIFFMVLSTVNLYIGVQILRNPGSFPSSYWDVRWAFIFAAAFLGIGLLSLLSQNRLLILFTFIGACILLFLPVFTIGAGAAYLMLALLVLIACGAGEFLLRILLGNRLSAGLERFAFSLLIGLGFVAALVAVQGMLFAFNSLVTWLGLAVLTLVFVIPNLKRWFTEGKECLSGLRSIWSSDGHLSWTFALAILVILWVPSWLIALSPANRYDEMTYHLAAPIYYLKIGGIAPFPEGGMTVWMHYAEMLYTLALQTADQPLPRMLHLLMGMLSALLVFLFGRRLANTRVGSIAALLFFAVPAVGYETATAYIDLFVTAYTCAFGFTLLVWWQEKNPRWLLVAGVLGGLGLGIKLTAGPMIAVLIAAIVIASIVNRRLVKDLPWLGAMLALVIGLALPWLIRDYSWTGDPFYPYGGMFMERMSSSASAGGATASVASGSSRLIKLIRYPIDLVFDSHLYYHEAPGGFASALPLLAFPFFIFSSVFTRKVKVVGLSLLAVNLVALAISILVNSALLRYALPTFPWLAICAALNLESVSVWLMSKDSKWGITALALTLLVYAFSTRLPLIVCHAYNYPQRFSLNYFLNREGSEQFLSRTVPVYDAFQFIDAQPGGPHRVLSIGNEFRLYTKSRIDSIYDVKETRNMVMDAKTPADLANSMKNSGYDYILINQPEVGYVKWKYVDPYPVLQNLEFLNSYGELVFTKNEIYVYRFDPEGVKLSSPINLLQNNSFEEVTSGKNFTGWEENEAIDASDLAYQGESSALIYAPLSKRGAGDISQRVSVQSGAIYTLEYWLLADPTAVFLMKVNWLDKDQQIISTEERWKAIDNTWKPYYQYLRAPSEAQFAEIHALLGNTNSVWIDDVCFAKGQQCPDVYGN